MSKCWAEGCGQCAQGPSKEHLLSAGLFDDTMISVQGFDWCLETPVEVGLSSLVAKILCRKHNYGLANVDAAGIAAVKAFETGAESKPESIDGIMFERWLLKTAINLSFKGRLHLGVGMADSVPGVPPAYLLAVVLGDLEFSHCMGAYFLIPDSDFIYKRGEILVTPLHKDGKIGAFYFHLRGVDILLSLVPGHEPPTLGELGTIEGLPKHVQSARPIRRCSSLAVTTNSGTARSIGIRWPGAIDHQH